MTAPTWPATAGTPITVPDLGCGHLPGECEDPIDCAYWRGVTAGEYPPPYMGADVVVLSPHCPGLTPLTDPALREVA